MRFVMACCGRRVKCVSFAMPTWQRRPTSMKWSCRGCGKAGRRIGIGSRPLRASNLLVHQPWYREMLGRGFNQAVRMLAVPGIADTQCGFKVFTADAAQEVFSRCRLDSFASDSESLYVATRLGYHDSRSADPLGPQRRL